MRVADIDLRDELDRILSCYEEYEVLLVTAGDAGVCKGNILGVLNEKLKEVIRDDGV